MQVVSRVCAVGLGFGVFVFSRDLFRFEFRGGCVAVLGRRGCRIRSGHHMGGYDLLVPGNPKERGGNANLIAYKKGKRR